MARRQGTFLCNFVYPKRRRGTHFDGVPGALSIICKESMYWWAGQREKAHRQNW